MENDLMSRSALLKKKREMELEFAVTERDIESAPAVDAVPVEKLGKFGRLFLPYKGCPRGRVGRMGDGHLEEEALFWGTIEDVDGGRWVPVVEAVLLELIEKAKSAVDANEAVHTADFLLANGVTVAKDTDVPSKWISIKDGLPGEKCLAYSSECMEMMIGYVSGCLASWTGYRCEDENETMFNVTHWIPLPEPPKEVKHE